MKKRFIVLSAPSGAGKTTVARHLLSTFPELQFSVSATTRKPRQGEQNGKDYWFLERSEFEERIAVGDLLEYEELYGNFYGTLRSVLTTALEQGQYLLFDVDVKGAVSIRNAFPDDSLLIFIAPPGMTILRERLIKRSTESAQQLELRLKRVEMEMQYQDSFNVVIVNDDLSQTLSEAERVVREELALG